MAFQSDQDWQLTKKTVLERNLYMFNNSLMSDIKFTCGESKRKYFYGHKYVLATSSPVFFAMFYGDLAEQNSVIDLEDTDEESLEEFLRFLYTDECTLTPEIAVSVMYLAKKYMILSLTEKCVKVLQDNMKPGNVVTVLEQAIQFDEEELETKCWKMIEDKTTEAVASDAFNEINQTTLINILKREILKIEELALFQGVLRWSESECARKGIEVTAKNRREVLGDVIFQIRFTSISQKEFAQYVASSGLLTADEIVPIYQTLNGCDDRSLKGKLPKREMKRMHKIRCCRFSDICSWYSVCPALGSECLSFSVNKPATFHGVCLFGDSNCNKYDVTLEVKNMKVSGTYTPKGKDKSSSFSFYDVLLPTPISVDENELVTMVATIKGVWPNLPRGGQASVKIDGAIVTFKDSHEPFNITRVEHGQFYEIILSI